MRATTRVAVQKDPSTFVGHVNVGGLPALIAGWQTAVDLPKLSLPPVSTVVSLRGHLPDWLCDCTDSVPSLAVRVRDGQAPHPLTFEVVCRWVDDVMDFGLSGVPMFCCWLGRSRSVVYAAVWMACRLDTDLDWVLQEIGRQYSEAEPHVSLLQAAFAFCADPVPAWAKDPYTTSD